MVKIKSNTVWIFCLTLAFMLIFLYAVIKIYNLTLSESKKSHQLQQMEMAKAAATGISTYLTHIEEDMHLLSFFPEIQFLNKNSVQLYVDYFLEHYEKEAVKAIFVTDINANIVYSKGDSLPMGSSFVINKQINWAKKPENKLNCWYSQVRPNSSAGEFYFLMLTPLVQKLQEYDAFTSNSKVVGMVGYLLSFDLLIQQFITPLKLTKNDFAWIIDGNGRLIYHPKHEEMLLRSINNVTPECSSCHSSFEMQNKMLVGNASMGEYSIGQEPTKIMAYTPIQLKNEKWVLVISTFLPEVTASLRENFRIFFILGVVILITIVTFGMLLYLANTKRIRAEESQHQAEQMQQLHQQLNQASKLASIGELVDTVAHEINTPSGIIAAQADALLLQMKQTNLYSEEINVIKEQTRRISKYIRSLLGYSKRVTFHAQPTQLIDLIDECVYLLGHRFRAQKISIKKNYLNNLPKLWLDRGQMEQVFINLFNNAVDSIEGQGEIKIKVKIIDVNAVFNESSYFKGVMIEIIDNGKGIEQENLSKIFEPFFSTKRPKESTGLGLYITKAIIKRHRGKIEVESKIGIGTTFRIFLPINSKG